MNGQQGAAAQLAIFITTTSTRQHPVEPVPPREGSQVFQEAEEGSAHTIHFPDRHPGGADGPIAEGRSDAEAEELGDGDQRHGSGGSPLRDPRAARKRLHWEEGDERSSSSPQRAREVASRRSRSPAEGGCREGSAE